MHTLKYAITLFTILSLACCCDGFKQIKTPEGTLAVPNCCPMIKYSGTSISVKGVDLAIPNAPVKIGEVTVEPKVIQQACDTVQILEQHRISTCQMLPSYATISKAKFAEALDAMQKDETILTQFALIVSTKNGAAIQKFVESYGPQAQYVKATMGTGKIYKTKKASAESLAEFKPSKGVTIVPLKELLK